MAAIIVKIMKYPCRIFRISVANFSKKSQNATNVMGSASPWAIWCDIARKLSK
jgi:hypothetical protein